VTVCSNCGQDNPDIARFCLACAQALATAEPLLEVERKLITVLFADIVGSTELGGAVDPERLRLVLNRYFSSMSAAIEAWGGTVEKFIGDAIMAVFGVPLVREDDPARALRAALEMLRRLNALNEELRERHHFTLDVRIAVNTGEVVAPTARSDQRLLVGDPANVAARLQTAAAAGTILVSDRTYQAVRDSFLFEDPIELNLKGKPQPVVARALLQARPDVALGAPRLRSGMIGRDEELQQLMDGLEKARSSACVGFSLLEAPPGTGKSRLVLEFLRGLSSRRPDVTVLTSRCVATGGGATWAVAELLRSACGISLDDSSELVADKLETALRHLLSRLALAPEDVENGIFVLAKAAGIFIPDNPLDRATAKEVAEQSAQAWPLFFRAQATKGPAVLIIEDLHWADEQLLEVLQHVADRTNAPLFVLATARPEFRSGHAEFMEGVAATTMTLEALAEHQANALVDQLVGGASLPPSFRAEIVAKADGNPFFLEEVMRSLIDQGGLVRDDGGWRASRGLERLPLPDTVHALLASRIDGLPKIEKRTLQEASVLGRFFWEDPLVLVLGESARSALAGLERRDFVLPRATSTLAGQTEFAFKHAMVRDVAYASLPRAHRARSHASVAEWLESTVAGREEEFAELLAHHFKAAASGEDADLAFGDEPARRENVRAKAVRALILAGSAARGRAALSRATELHRDALALAATDVERVQALEELGEDQQASFYGEDAIAAYLEALEIARADASMDASRARLCMKAASTIAQTPGAFREAPDPALADELVTEGLSVASEEATRAGLLSARAWIGTVSRYAKRPDPLSLGERLGAAEEALAIARRRDLPEVGPQSAVALGELRWLRGDFSAAADAYRIQLEFLERVRSKLTRVDMFRRLAEASLFITGDFDEAFEFAKRAYELSTGGGPHERMHCTYWLIASPYLSGRWDELPAYIDEHVAAFREEPALGCRSVRGGLAMAALALMQRGELRQAEEVMTLLGGDPWGSAGGSEGIKALVKLASGEAVMALEMARRYIAQDEIPRPFAHLAAVEAVVQLQDWNALPDALAGARRVQDALVILGPGCDRAEGMALAAAGESTHAETLLRKALARFEELGVPFETARTLEALATVVPPGERRTLSERAGEIYERLGARPSLERLRRQHKVGANG
jgi:class 3 adenylate cyclase/tetratricopeptide (TPR) repeat protein